MSKYIILFIFLAGVICLFFLKDWNVPNTPNVPQNTVTNFTLDGNDHCIVYEETHKVDKNGMPLQVVQCNKNLAAN